MNKEAERQYVEKVSGVQKAEKNKETFWDFFIELISNKKENSTDKCVNAFLNIVAIFPELAQDCLNRLQALRPEAHKKIMEIGSTVEEIITKIQKAHQDIVGGRGKKVIEKEPNRDEFYSMYIGILSDKERYDDRQAESAFINLLSRYPDYINAALASLERRRPAVYQRIIKWGTPERILEKIEEVAKEDVKK